MIVVLFVLTFLESIAATLIQRGVYFYTHENLGFTQSHNLWIAFGFGVTYVGGRLRQPWPEPSASAKSAVLLGCIVGLFALHSLLALVPGAWVLVASVLGTAIVQGIKWPVVESYVSAGRAPEAAVGDLEPLQRHLGHGRLRRHRHHRADRRHRTCRRCSSGSRRCSTWARWRWRSSCRRDPLHLEHSHPERPAEGELQSMRALLGSARWSMIGSYALFYVLAPLMPSLLAQLALPVTLATPVASILDAVRVITFGALGAIAGWHGKRAPLWLTTAALPAGFLADFAGQFAAARDLGRDHLRRGRRLCRTRPRCTTRSWPRTLRSTPAARTRA